MYNIFVLLCCAVSIKEKENYYQMLQVPPDATQIDIRKAYLRKARELHPDKNHDINATFCFQRLQEAHGILNDPILRDEYDKTSQHTCDEIRCCLAMREWQPGSPFKK